MQVNPLITNALIKRKARPVLVTGLWAVLVAYFGYHAVQGEHGLLARNELSAQVQQAEARLDELRSERERLEARVDLLSPDAVDRDMLDERARAMLNYAHPDDVVIFLRER
jgi:cell division protein FtsB